MHGILHRIIVEASPEQLFKAIAEDTGVTAWWTKAEAKNSELMLPAYGLFLLIPERSSPNPYPTVSMLCC